MRHGGGVVVASGGGSVVGMTTRVVLLLTSTVIMSAAVLLTSTSASTLAVLEPRDWIPSTVVRANARRTHGVAAATRGATSTSLHSECLGTSMVVLRGGVDLSALKTGAGV
jgi:hypothetical protein